MPLQVNWDESFPPAQEVYRALLLHLDRGLVLQSRTGAIVACNAQAERLLGLSFDQLIGRTSTDPRWRALRADGSPFPGDEHPAMVALRTGEPQRQGIMGVARPEGSVTWISIDARPLRREAGGEIYGVVAFFDDVTERLAADASMRESLAERTRLAADLRRSLDRLQSVARLIPVCASCKGVRDEQGYWQRIEGYLIEQLGRKVTHGLCPICMDKLYP